MKQIALLLLLSAPLTFAQNLGMGQGPGMTPGQGMGNHSSNLNLAAQVTIEGPISALSLAYGAQYPSITVNQKLIKVAPVWFLLDNGIELALNDKVKVTAAPSSLSGDTALYALSITKGTKSLTLRDSLGVPLWTGKGAGQAAPHSGDPCLDLANTKTAKGTIVSVEAGLGIQYPTLVLKLADSTLLTFKLGPERLLLAADFELKAGDAISVTYATCTENDELVVLSLTNAAGVTITLRDGDGWPMHP